MFSKEAATRQKVVLMTAWWLRVLSLATVTMVCTAADLPDHVFVGYHDSWNEWPASTPQQTSLARLPGYINLVLLAFAKPDAIYRGDLDISRTGLEYRMPGNVLHEAIMMLKQSHPSTRVLLSVGGAAYRRWDHMALSPIAALLRDFNLDGVDIDFEPSDPQCEMGANGEIECATDQTWDRIVDQIRSVVPRPLLVTASVWSVGAYGEGDYTRSQPRTSYTGVMLPLLRTARATDLDLLSINAYDAGPRFDPMESFRAYRLVWPGRLALGMEVQWASGTGPFQSAGTAEALASEILKDPLGGIMLYPLLALPEGGPLDRPTGSDLARALCRGLGFTACSGTIP
jgi:chitinase